MIFIIEDRKGVVALTKQMCDLKTISNYLDVSIPYLRKLVRAKLIPHYRFGNRIKFDIKEINEWIETHAQKDKENVLFF